MDILIKGKTIRIEYSKDGNTHVLGINDRPFNAISNKSKKVEYRTNTPHSPFDFNEIKVVI
ncbi:MAG: hypothetical protein TR69_WS6001001251 [candidate division WS6 bacterium OLB20]|uniref:Uncharacterized protein n=1 Tax=candidate division WS6 bacterium OLB20 TaxID=1617426 RepID=A0A136LX96_9BACT|nr:MAG: hypothetical protein TR69_WS6001001251 [candidate division WS6 bacterium OLB20]